MEFAGVEGPSKLRNYAEDGDCEQSEYEGELSPTMMQHSQVASDSGGNMHYRTAESKELRG
eukprot:6655022-Alexandrium_andersonii.AAC.1